MVGERGLGEIDNMVMSRTELVESWKREENEPFSGWDFSYMIVRVTENFAD
jgi:hypothetical protein